jgi:hypothetical protein
MGSDEDEAGQSTNAWSLCHWVGNGLTSSIVPATGLRFGEPGVVTRPKTLGLLLFQAAAAAIVFGMAIVFGVA